MGLEVLAAAAATAVLLGAGVLRFEFDTRLLLSIALAAPLRLLYVDWAVDDDEGVAMTENLLLELQLLFMLML